SALIRGGRGLESVAAGDALDHVAERIRSTVERFGPGSVAVLASGEQTCEEAHAWARLLEGLGGGVSVAGPEGGAGWAALAPYSASIEELEQAELIVVAGDFDLSQRAPVLELRIRKAVSRHGARVVTVGAGGTRLETLRGATHVSAAPGTAHTVLLDAAGGKGELGAAMASSRTVVIWNAPLHPPVAGLLAHVAHRSGCRILPTPLSANELGCQAAGLGTHTPHDALEKAESGEVKAILLIGSDPVGDWPQGERWRTALGRAFFTLQSSAFQNDSTGWVTTVLPAWDLLEQDGTLTNLEGRVQRLRAAATPPAGVTGGYPWVAELAQRLGVELPYDPPAAFAELAAAGGAFAGMSYAGIGERAPLPGRPAPGEPPAEPRLAESAVASAAGEVLVAGYRQLLAGPAADRSPHLHFQRRRGIELSHDDAVSLEVASGDQVTVEYGGRSVTGPAVVSRRLRAGVVRLATRVPYVGPGTVTPAAEEGADA
ncbi:MAG: molybdopterin-dependent oxidoreductase, partial [Gaiellales bacterium]